MAKIKPKNETASTDLWDKRKQVLEAILGPSTGTVLHSPVPLALGGIADVLTFRHFVKGYCYVTADLTGGESGQLPTSLGTYEIVICVRKALPLAANLVAQLGKYSLSNPLEPGETMDIGSYFGQRSVDALIFSPLSNPPEKFKVEEKKCGLLLCLGITRAELNFKMEYGSDALLKRLQKASIIPYTDIDRASVIE